MLPNSKQLLTVALLLFAATASGQLPQNNWQNQNQQQFGGNQDGCCEDYCYSTDEDPYIHFATKTAYDSLNRRSGSQHIVPDCTPIQFWSIIRQGINIPDVLTIERFRNLEKLKQEISKNYEQKRSYPDRGRLCTQDYDLFKGWRWNNSITENKAGTLSAPGKEELRLLARRYQSKYPQLFQEPYDENTYHFQYTNTDKIEDSYLAYTEGLFGSNAYKIHANVRDDAAFTRPIETCKTWTDTFGENNNTEMLREYDRFVKGPEYMQMVRDVFTRLGFKFALNETIINDIYDNCRYEKAWNIQQRSPWCIAFTTNHLKLLEYAEDLKEYYTAGHGNQMVAKIGCTFVKDFYEKFKKAVKSGQSDTKATFFFTNSFSLLSVLTAMGLEKDFTPLTADNYYQQNRRNWRTSLIDPFASNFAATLYECRGREKHKVMFFLNESPVELAECSVGLCDWSVVKEKFRSLVKHCDIDDFCNGNSANIFYSNYLIYAFALTLMYFKF